MHFINKYIYKYSSAAFFLIYSLGAAYLAFTDFTDLSLYIFVPVCTLFTNQIIRKIVKRKRPCDNKEGYSFPSNHSASAGIIGLACLTINLWLGVFVLFLALITGISRVVAGVHYTSDVAAGFALSIIFAVLGFCVLPGFLWF